MKQALIALVTVLLAVGSLAGCDSGSVQPNNLTKADFAKAPPPPGYMSTIPKGPGAGPPAAGAQAPGSKK